MNNPLISIIIPTYNRAHIIGETLNSLISQSFLNWECIVIDDESTDNTEEVLKLFSDKNSKIKYFKRPSHLVKGASSCRNYGYSIAIGEWIHFMDSDDLYLPFALQNYSQEFSSDNDVVIAKLELIDANTNLKIKETSINNTNLIEDYFVGKVAFYVSGPIWKKSFLNNQTEIFDESISNLDDWDFNLRMIYQSPNISYINQPLIQYIVSDNSLSQEINKLNLNEIKSELLAREKHIKILKNNNLINPKLLQMFLINRYKYFLREALINNNQHKNFYLKILLKNQLLLFDIIGIAKTIFGFSVYNIFRKGYKFLK